MISLERFSDEQEILNQFMEFMPKVKKVYFMHS